MIAPFLPTDEPFFLSSIIEISCAYVSLVNVGLTGEAEKKQIVLHQPH